MNAASGPSIALWCPVGHGNLGNEMSLTAAIQGLRECDPSVGLTAISWAPDNTAAVHHIESIPLKRGKFEQRRYGVGAGGARPSRLKQANSSARKVNPVRSLARRATFPLKELVFWKRSLQLLRGTDLLMFAGTGPFTDDWGGPWNLPYSTYGWSTVARLAKARVAVASVGAGPIQFPLSRKFIAGVCRRADYTSFRDPASRQLVETFAPTNGSPVVPDLVFGLNLESHPKAQHKLRREVAIAGLPYRKPGHWHSGDSAVYERYLRCVGDNAIALLDRGYDVRLIATQLTMDPAFTQDLSAYILERRQSATGGDLICSPPDSFSGIIDALSHAEIVLTSRFHGVVFSYLLSKPVIALSYHQKIRDLMRDFGHEEFCFDIESAPPAGLSTTIADALGRSSQLSSQIETTVGSMRTALNRQYRDIIELATRAHQMRPRTQAGSRPTHSPRIG